MSTAASPRGVDHAADLAQWDRQDRHVPAFCRPDVVDHLHASLEGLARCLAPRLNPLIGVHRGFSVAVVQDERREGALQAVQVVAQRGPRKARPAFVARELEDAVAEPMQVEPGAKTEVDGGDLSLGPTALDGNLRNDESGKGRPKAGDETGQIIWHARCPKPRSGAV